MVTDTCNGRHSGTGSRRIVNSRPTWAKLVRPYLKINTYIHTYIKTKELRCGLSGKDLA
jgi:hypothetical protein